MHIPVLLKEVVDGLALKSGQVVLDGTVGAGGHASRICELLGAEGRLIGIDADREALVRARKSLAGKPCQASLIEENYRQLDKILDLVGFKEVDAILFDLGLSSYQLEESGRGFSFQRDELLQMTFGVDKREYKFTAEDIVNKWSKDELVAILEGFGDEKYAARIAQAIVEARKDGLIKTSRELAEIVWQAVPASYRRERIHPATKTFQAIRIAVNDELGALEEGLEKGFGRLKSGGRLAVISFHDREDRIVKTFFKKLKEEGKVELVSKKAIKPGREEIRLNPRSRSARLRICQKR